MSFHAEIESDGSFELDLVTPGRYELRYGVGGIALVAQVNFVVEAGQAVELGDIQLPAACRIDATDAAGRSGAKIAWFTGRSLPRDLVLDVVLRQR